MPSRGLTATVCGAIGVALLAGPANGQSVWGDMARDGSITVQEVRENSEAAFRSLDRNGDGVITSDEFVQQRLPAEAGPEGYSPDQRERLFGMIDGNDDGAITRQEWESSLQENVSMADRDGDGRVTLEELSQVDLGTVLSNFFGF